MKQITPWVYAEEHDIKRTNQSFQSQRYPDTRRFAFHAETPFPCQGALEMDFTRFLPCVRPVSRNLIATGPDNAMDDWLEAVITPLYAMGLRAREIELSVRRRCNHSVSAAAIANIGAKLQAYITQWKGRRLARLYPALFVDDMAFMVTRNGRLVERIVRVITGIDADGKMETLSVWPGVNGNNASWKSIFVDLRARGVEKVLVTSSDARDGLTKAFSSVFHGQTFFVSGLRRVRDASAGLGGKGTRRPRKQMEAAGCMPGRIPVCCVNCRFLNAICAWKNYAHALADFFSLPPGIRQLVCSTDASQHLYQQIKALGDSNMTFPEESALTKAAFVALRQVNERVTMRIRHWNKLAQEFAVMSERQAEIKASRSR